MSAPDVVVVGGGLAGITAALDLADAGASVTLLERRRRLGGLTWSFEHAGRQIDNGQHVFLRCCHAYRSWLARIGSDADVALQPRLDVTAVRPAPVGGGRAVTGVLRRNNLPAPLHLGPTLLRYRHLSVRQRAAVGPAVLALRRLDLADPALDAETFGAWLGRHGQDAEAVAALWDLITVATVNLPATEASLAMGAMVFKTGLLLDASAADIGWSRIPLGRLHGERSADALRAAGVEVRLGHRALAVGSPAPGRWAVETAAGDDRPDDGGRSGSTPEGTIEAGAVVVALPHQAAGAVLPAGSIDQQDHLDRLGSSAIVNVHVLYDRPVTDRELFAGVGGLVQWVFDRTASSGHTGPGQYLAVSLSAADRLLPRRPAEIAADVVAELGRLLPAAAGASVVDTLVTKERAATFHAGPGSARFRPPAATHHPRLAVAGAWTGTGWPATMEGAVRSGHAAADAILGAASCSHQTRITEEVA